MVVTVSGRIKSKDSNSATLGGCRIDIYYNLKALVAGSDRPQLSSISRDIEASRTPTRQVRVSSRTDQHGRFSIHITDEIALLGKTPYMVVGPAGHWASQCVREIGGNPAQLF